MKLYSFKDYRKYLAQELGSGQRNGLRQRLSEALGCQAAHLSQVLNGKNHLSIEHCFGVSRFFGHTEKEAEYFLNIVQASRAGTVEATEYFEEQARKIKEHSLKLLDRISEEKRELSPEQQAIYYGDGLYALAHVASSLPSVKTAAQLAQLMDVDLDAATKVIEFLLQAGVIVRKNDSLMTGPGHTMLGIDSPHMKKHHLNLRLHGLRRIERGLQRSNVHYATYFTLSKDDAFQIKQQILDLIDRNLKVVAPSPEEVLYCNIIDFFEVPTGSGLTKP